MIPSPSTPPNPVWIAVAVSSLSVVVTIAGWFVVDCLAKRRERCRDRRAERKRIQDGFLGVIDKEKCALGRMSDVDDFRPFVCDSIRRIEDAVSQVGRGLPASQLVCLQTVLEDYKQQNPKEYSGVLGDNVGPTMKAMVDSMVDGTLTSSKERLECILNRFSNCLKDADVVV
jgi:hypothetical protein